MAKYKFLDIKGIDDSELMHVGATLVYKLGEVENFKAYMSLYFQKKYLPFITGVEELYKYITLVGEIYISSIIQKNKAVKIDGLKSSRHKREEKNITEENLITIGKICLIFSSLGALDFEFKDAPILIKSAHRKFKLGKREMISITAEIHTFSYMVHNQLDKAGMINYEDEPNES